jgi:hypothetical protein
LGQQTKGALVSERGFTPRHRKHFCIRDADGQAPLA